jgi:hypothetical protein
MSTPENESKATRLEGGRCALAAFTTSMSCRQHRKNVTAFAYICNVGDIFRILLVSMGDVQALRICSQRLNTEVSKVIEELGKLKFLRGMDLKLLKVSRSSAVVAPVIGAARVCTVGHDVCAVGEYDKGFIPFVDLATWSRNGATNTKVAPGNWVRTKTRGERPRFFGGQQSVFLSNSKQLLCFSYADDKQKMDFSSLFTLTLETAQWERLLIRSSATKPPAPRIGFAIAHVSVDVSLSQVKHSNTDKKSAASCGALFMYGGQCGRVYLDQLYILCLKVRSVRYHSHTALLHELNHAIYTHAIYAHLCSSMLIYAHLCS